VLLICLTKISVIVLCKIY